MRNQQGQVVLILILVMTVALAIGLSVIQRSIADVSTATKVEQSSRAFSAAEAGIEQSLQTGGNIDITPLENNSQYQTTNRGLIPAVASSGTQQDPWECPPRNPLRFAKEDMAQVWLANPDTLAAAYKQTSLEVYWGNSTDDKAALELTLVYYGTEAFGEDAVTPNVVKYRNHKWYLDHTFTRSPDNKFTQVACTGYANSLGTNYSCKYILTSLPSSPSILMLLRARLLYNTTSQPFAVQAVLTCGADCSIPPQTKFITSIGTSGQTQRKVQVCETQKVVPPYFDYAIFSVGEISK